MARAVIAVPTAKITASSGCQTRNRRKRWAEPLKSCVIPSRKETAGNNVSPSAVIAPLTPSNSAAASIARQAASTGRDTGRRGAGAPLEYHAVSASVASSKNVFVRWAEIHQPRAMLSLRATILNSTSPAPTAASLQMNTRDAIAARLAARGRPCIRCAHIASPTTAINAKPELARWANSMIVASFGA